MNKNIRSSNRLRSTSRIRFGAAPRVPRGLLLLRALRLRLAAEKYPRFRQSEFCFAELGQPTH